MTVKEIEEVQIGLNANGCGHQIVMTAEHYKACRESGRTWYCTVCGCARCYPKGESEAKKMRRERDAALQREETLKADRERLRAELSKKDKEAKRLKKRATNGVCPCCTRSFTNLRRHMATKHPDHATTCE